MGPTSYYGQNRANSINNNVNARGHMIGTNQSQSAATTTSSTTQNRTMQTYNQLSQNGIVRKRVENLPRTGIEHPMMKELGHAPFISA